jgi:malonyl-ACP decarboxylase
MYRSKKQVFRPNTVISPLQASEIMRVKMRNTNNKRVFVSGMGCVNSIAESAAEFEQALKEGRQGIDFYRESQQKGPIKIGAEIRNFSLNKRMDHYFQNESIPQNLLNKARKITRRSPFVIQTAIAAVLEAYIQADLFQKQISGERIGIIVAGNNLTNAVKNAYVEKCKNDLEYMSPSYALQFMDTDHIGTLSEIFGIFGEGCTVGGASASGNVGIIKAHEMLQLGIADICIVVGAMAELSDAEMYSFYNIGALGGRKFATEPGKACRPFDREHEGFIYGQGCGCFILESQESVSKRNVNVLAEMMGGAILLDGNRLSNPSEKGEARVMELALDRCGLVPEDIDYINAHGTSSPLGDETELKAIEHVWKDNVKNVWINSTKGLIGHCLYAAGVMEAIASIIQMKEGFLHPNQNLVHPIQKGFRFVGNEAEERQIDTAISNSFGFGGINTSIVLKHCR